MLSKKAKYALKALLFISKQNTANPVTAKTISIQEGIPYKFLENILRELKQNKILKSTRGPEGGYTFFRKPEEITVADIHRIIDGPIAPSTCVSENFYQKCAECKDEESCQLRKLFMILKDQMVAVLSTPLTEVQKLP
jgi:Rrf2 family protein